MEGKPPYQNWNVTEVQKIEIFSKYLGNLAAISSGEMYLESRNILWINNLIVQGIV